jgi:hypothetical protein
MGNTDERMTTVRIRQTSRNKIDEIKQKSYEPIWHVIERLVNDELARIRNQHR